MTKLGTLKSIKEDAGSDKNMCNIDYLRGLNNGRY